MDLEAFEKELGAEGGEKEDGDGGMPEYKEEDLGDDPFAVDDAPAVVGGINTGKEPWIGSERDYKYTEVCPFSFLERER